ncbi:MAG: hypothetical protein ACOC2J_03435 [bacterium]
MDTVRQKKSIKSFISKDLNIETVYTAHTGYTENFAKAAARWR